VEPGRGSLTAERVAERRAAHQMLDRPRVFDDPLAIRMIRPHAAGRIREEAQRRDRSALSCYLRAFVSMRSRFAEDELARAYASGVRQYVLLGAGFDTFAYRNAHADLRVFEVDHPATQAVKRRRLEASGIVVPPTLTFVPVDLTEASLRAALDDAGFDATSPALFAWLGVSMYLSLEDVRTTLGIIGSLARGTCLVFDYAVPPSSLGWIERVFYRLMIGRVARIGEPWKTFLTPDDLVAELARAGLELEEDLGPGAINARYFAGRDDGLKVSSAGRIARACVRTSR